MDMLDMVKFGRIVFEIMRGGGENSSPVTSGVSNNPDRRGLIILKNFTTIALP